MAGEAQSTPAVEDAQVAGPATAAHALLWGLRQTRDEAELTQVIAEVCRADRGFANAFVELLLDTAERDALTSHVRGLKGEGVRGDIECRAEQHLRDSDDISLGRVDLRFDGHDLTLFVENKLYSGYGDEQLDRYRRALRRLPPGRRSALIAVTRTVPTYGEAELDDDPSWLGSVRWARMLPGLRALPIADASLAEQWKLLLDILDQQGDLGMTTVDAELIRAWARYREGRAQLELLLSQVWPAALDIVRRELTLKHPDKGDADGRAGIYRRGRQGQVVVQRDQASVFIAFCVSAVVKDDPALRVQFNAQFGVPHFTVQAEPWASQERLDADDAELARASEELRSLDFKTNGKYWAHVHEPDEYLQAADVPATLLGIIEKDVGAIVASGILDHDLEAGLSRAPGGPSARKRWPLGR